MALPAPRICCLDLDTFFVSVERVLNPALVGKPVVVGGRPRQRGVVTAASYEVRSYGVRSGMSLTRAYELAPHAIFLPTRHDVYGDYAQRVRRIAEAYTPVSQVASIDEMYLDFSGCESMYRLAGDASPDATIERIVRELVDDIKEYVALPASAGIAASRSVAKVASGLAKPNGVLLVAAGAEAELLSPLPVRKFPGIGPVAEQKLHALGLTTLGQVAAAPKAHLRPIFGAWTDSIQRGCRGLGPHELGRERPAFQEHDPTGCAVGSISNERTFREDVRDPGSIDAMLCALCERVCWRARKRGIKGRTVTLKLRYADFHTLTRSRTIAPTCSELELYPVVRELFERARRRSVRPQGGDRKQGRSVRPQGGDRKQGRSVRPQGGDRKQDRRLAIRLLGIALSKLGRYDEQLPLFADGAALHRTVDGIRQRHGYDALRIALARSGRKRSYGP